MNPRSKDMLALVKAMPSTIAALEGLLRFVDEARSQVDPSRVGHQLELARHAAKGVPTFMKGIGPVEKKLTIAVVALDNTFEALSDLIHALEDVE